MKITAKKKTKTMTNANETVQISVGNNELEQGNCFVCLRGNSLKMLDAQKMTQLTCKPEWP